LIRSTIWRIVSGLLHLWIFAPPITQKSRLPGCAYQRYERSSHGTPSHRILFLSMNCSITRLVICQPKVGFTSPKKHGFCQKAVFLVVFKRLLFRNISF
jgi:hypothetical protein